MPDPGASLDISRYQHEHGLSDDDVRALLAGQTHWFHSFEFGNGLTTPGRDPSRSKLDALDLPARLDGQSVLDVGAYDGYFSFQCEKRGAARVVAADSFIWRFERHRTAFRLVHQLLGSVVEERDIAVEQLSPETVGTFDLVLFLGVLYHTKDMPGYLERIRSVTSGVAIVETLVDMLDVESPSARYYPPLFPNRRTLWWGPNRACVEGMLRSAGFSRIEYKGLWAEHTVAELAGTAAPEGPPTSGRAVWHAHV